MYTQVILLKALVLDATQVSVMYLRRPSHRTNYGHSDGLKGHDFPNEIFLYCK